MTFYWRAPRNDGLTENIPLVSMTLSMSPYSTASLGCKYLTREQSAMTSSVLFPHAVAMSSQVVFRLCMTSRRLDGNVGGLSAGLRLGLVEQNGGIGEGVSVSALSLTQEHGRGTKCLSNRHGMNGRTDILHDVGNGKGFGLESDRLARGGRRAAGIDVHGDGLRRALIIQVQEFGNDQFGHCRDQRHANVHDAVVQQQRR